MLLNKTMKAAPIALAAMLAGCGGAGGVVNSTPVAVAPTPTPSPTPTPTPSPAPVQQPDHIGLVSAAPFKALGFAQEYRKSDHGQTVAPTQTQSVAFSYDAASETYTITLPILQPGKLVTTSYNGGSGELATSTSNDITLGNSATLQNATVALQVPGTRYSPYSYTSWGTWGAFAPNPDSLQSGVFVYGIPTAATDVPLSGSASYGAKVVGQTSNGNYVDGTAALNFNFAAGTLTGNMTPEYCPWDCVSLGRYDFTQTVYAAGSPNFSGQFNVPGSSGPSSFEGSFTGPQATELMARWQAPFLNPDSNVWGTMFGIWIGKKQ